MTAPTPAPAAKPCPRSKPHPPHVWLREARTPVFGTIAVNYSCPGRATI